MFPKLNSFDSKLSHVRLQKFVLRIANLLECIHVEFTYYMISQGTVDRTLQMTTAKLSKYLSILVVQNYYLIRCGTFGIECLF